MTASWPGNRRGKKENEAPMTDSLSRSHSPRTEDFLSAHQVLFTFHHCPIDLRAFGGYQSYTAPTFSGQDVELGDVGGVGITAMARERRAEEGETLLNLGAVLSPAAAGIRTAAAEIPVRFSCGFLWSLVVIPPQTNKITLTHNFT